MSKKEPSLEEVSVWLQGKLNGNATWLERHCEGKNKRGQMDIDQHLRDRDYYIWIKDVIDARIKKNSENQK